MRRAGFVLGTAVLLSRWLLSWPGHSAGLILVSLAAGLIIAGPSRRPGGSTMRRASSTPSRTTPTPLATRIHEATTSSSTQPGDPWAASAIPSMQASGSSDTVRGSFTAVTGGALGLRLQAADSDSDCGCGPAA